MSKPNVMFTYSSSYNHRRIDIRLDDIRTLVYRARFSGFGAFSWSRIYPDRPVDRQPARMLDYGKFGWPRSEPGLLYDCQLFLKRAVL